MSEKLLPCPFCGGEASLALTNRNDERSGYRATFSAYCKTCSGMTARTSTTDKNGWNNEGDESIKRRVTEAWNRRTPAPEGETWRIVPAEPTADMRRAFEDARPDTAIQDGEGGWTAPYTDWFRANYTAMLAASPVVPVGVRERVLDELDKAWLHGQRRTPWRRDESADAILAALRPTDTGWRDIATAPRDGTAVVGWGFLNSRNDNGPLRSAVMVAHVMRYRNYASGGGDWVSACLSNVISQHPTHWMPLPSAPTDTGRE